MKFMYGTNVLFLLLALFVAVEAKGYRGFTPTSHTRKIKGFGSLWAGMGLAGVMTGTGAAARYLRYDRDSNQIYMRDATMPLTLEGMEYWVGEEEYKAYWLNKTGQFGYNGTDENPDNIQRIESNITCVYSITGNDKQIFKDVPAQKLNESDTEKVKPNPYLWITNVTKVTKFLFECKKSDYKGCCDMECCNPMPWWGWIIIAAGIAIISAGIFGIIKWAEYNKRKDREAMNGGKNGVVLSPPPTAINPVQTGYPGYATSQFNDPGWQEKSYPPPP